MTVGRFKRVGDSAWVYFNVSSASAQVVSSTAWAWIDDTFDWLSTACVGHTYWSLRHILNKGGPAWDTPLSSKAHSRSHRR